MSRTRSDSPFGSSTKAIKYDTVEIVRTLRLIMAPGQVTELRALDSMTTSDRRPHVESGYFDDFDKLAEAVASITRAKGIYFTPNPVNPALLSRAANRIRPAGKEPTTNDRDILVRRWLLVDCDPVRSAGISSSDTEHEASLTSSITIPSPATPSPCRSPLSETRAGSGNQTDDGVPACSD